ncbi:MAG: hypothetical protein GF335_03895 [Candidatus Moranbacteria bacterium]|nr:hypothetical protein [Candidatus Moranbacteria bacterium]
MESLVIYNEAQLILKEIAKREPKIEQTRRYHAFIGSSYGAIKILDTEDEFVKKFIDDFLDLNWEEFKNKYYSYT